MIMEPIILPRISDQKPLVSVVSITYNHEPYIRDCLEGFLKQKTNFPVEYIIHDDASTDHTTNIIREYYEKRPDLFHIIIETENQYSKHKSILFPLYEIAQGKYVALCEGDDYWTDPYKLQKQFDFMESNPEYTMCGTEVLLLYQKCYIRKKRKGRHGEITTDQLLCANPYATCSTFFRKGILLEWINISSNYDKKRWKMGDYPLYIFCSTYGKGYIHSYITACYRVHEDSASSHYSYQKTLVFNDSAFHICLQLIKELHIHYPTAYIIKHWAFYRIKMLLKWKKTASIHELRFYWKKYWIKKETIKESIIFIFMFCLSFTITQKKILINKITKHVF